jgi:hypothetical protein
MACNAMPRRGPVSIAPIVVQVNCPEFVSRIYMDLDGMSAAIPCRRSSCPKERS